MATSHPPREPDGDAFLDALAGLDSVCRYVGIVLGKAARPGGPDPGDASLGRPGEADGESPEGIIDALLGLVSVHRTVSLLLAAVGAEVTEVTEVTEVCDGADAGQPALDGPPAWSREVLR